nr:hypothetical protein MDV076.8 [synthetic construct]ACF49634.1 hypothetical protein MDV005.2 [synthetic construct]
MGGGGVEQSWAQSSAPYREERGYR